MALELNKKKYLVLCVMLILLNHHIKEAKGAGSQDHRKGSKPDEANAPASEFKVEAPENGAKGAGSQDHKKRSKPDEANAPASGSKAEAPENGAKGAGSQDHKKRSKPDEANAPSSGSKAEAPENGAKGAGSQDHKKRSKYDEANTPASGSKAEAPENGAKGAGSQDHKKRSKPDEANAPASGSKAEAPENGSKSKAEAPVNEAPRSGSKTLALQVPKYATKGGPRIMKNGSKPLISAKSIKITDIGTTADQPQVPCYFIFGDSLVDAGNNNRLNTLARADYDPYGIDFKPLGATGRFSNGKTTVDFLADMLGFDHYIPPSEQTNGTDILQGLNFASAAAGIRDETAQHLGDRISMKRQVDNFKNKVGEMAGLLGGPKNTTDYLGKCLFQVGLGSNDYLNNYFVPSIYPTSKQLTPEQYADDLIKQYTTHLMAIYDLGARKIVLTGVSQVGCTPNALAQHSPDGTCVKSYNDANEMFNTRLRTLTDTLNKDHPDAKFTYVNSYGLFQELKNKASTFGFKVTTDGCCGIGKYNGQLTCLPGLTTCPNRDEYIFWDAYHPTEATNRIVARRSYIKEIPSDAYPYDIHTLLTLK